MTYQHPPHTGRLPSEKESSRSTLFTSDGGLPSVPPKARWKSQHEPTGVVLSASGIREASDMKLLKTSHSSFHRPRSKSAISNSLSGSNRNSDRRERQTLSSLELWRMVF